MMLKKLLIMENYQMTSLKTHLDKKGFIYSNITCAFCGTIAFPNALSLCDLFCIP